MRIPADRLDLSRFHREGKLTEVELWRAQLPAGVKAPGVVAPDGTLHALHEQALRQRIEAIADGGGDDPLTIELGENEITIGDHGVGRH